ncbi:MAG TPA: LppX_LprAFG lipoprotein [Actinomycetes bacterium]|nr:LppX_LprAFG lipoprotein [Actinomycetes bacterium]
MRNRLSLLPLALLPILAGSLLTGCRGASDLEVVQKSPDKTAGAGSSNFQFEIHLNGSAIKQEVTLTGDGAFEFKAGKGTVNIQMPAADNGKPVKIPTVINAGVVYQQYPEEVAKQLPGGKPWVKIDVGKLRQGTSASALAQGQSSNPTASLAYLRGVDDDKDVKKVGTEKLREAATTHYVVTLDLRTAAARGGVDRDTIEDFAIQLGSQEIPADVWIDEEGRVRRLRYLIDTSKATSNLAPAGSTKVATSLELFDFGTQVKADPPPSSQVTDATKLLTQQQQQQQQ